MSDARVLTAWARVLIASLRDAGVRDVVMSPGSRSTPYVAAAVEAGLRVTPIVDERSAAFYALGQAKATGVPSVLLCTSGTAGAHYYPAVIEAWQSRAPLIVITADRPPELHHCAAPQTVDQIKLYGDRVRHFADLGPPDGSERALRAVRRAAAQAVYAATASPAGPVHLNAPARKPLEPTREDLSAPILAEPLTRVAPPVRTATDEGIDELVRACAASRRGVIAAGPAAVADARYRRAAYALARATGYPLCAEAPSQLRFAGRDAPPELCDGFDLLLSAAGFRAGHRPDVIIEIGAPPTSRAWADYVAEAPSCRRFVVCENGWNDPHSSAAALVIGDVASTLSRAAERMPAQQPSQWSQDFTAGNHAVWQCVERRLDDGDAPLTEGAAMASLAAALPEDTLLFLGNSLPVRNADAFCRARTARFDVMSQRGASGIDGLISGAAGAASAVDRPVALVLGDVSFLHDIGGLAAARSAAVPLCIIVIDNVGGRIFDMLPIAGDPRPEAYEQLWRTPPSCDVGAAAALFGHWFERARTANELGAALRETATTPGCTVIHVVVEPTSALTARRAIVAELEALR